MGISTVIANQKGGVGKSLLTFNFGYILATEHNQKVLFVDIDGQSSIAEILGGAVHSDTSLTSSDLLMNAIDKEDDMPSQFINHTDYENIDIIVNNRKKSKRCNISLVGVNNRELILKEWMERYKAELDEYDYIFFDVDASFQLTTLNVLMAVDNLVIVVTSDFESLTNVDGYIHEFTALTEYAQEQRNAFKGILLNDILESRSMGQGVLDAVYDDEYPFKDFLFDNIIHTAEVIKQTKFHGKTFKRHENNRAYDELRKVIVEFAEGGVF